MKETIIVSSATENYLETILECAQKNGDVRVTDLALSLGISKASVNQAMAKLKQKGLVTQEKYGPLSLTEEGLRMATKVKDRHHILKAFLTEVLDVPGEVAEQDACKMEHILNAVTMQKITEFLTKYITSK